METMLFTVLNENEKALPIYIEDIGSEHVQEHVTRPQGYGAYQWIQCYHGQGVLYVNGRQYLVKKNSGMLLYPHESHEYKKKTDNWMVDFISFNGSMVKDTLYKHGLMESGAYAVTESEMILGKIRKAIAVLGSNDYMKNYECSSIAYSILMDIIKYKLDGRSSEQESPYSRIQLVIEYINQHYDRPLTLEELAELLTVTPQHLCILFKNTLSMRPFEYITKVRINNSKAMMNQQKNIKIEEVARQVGYESTSYYCSNFKKMEGMTPKTYQRLYT